MNEFNPFDDLGITFDGSNDNRRDRQYTSPFDDTDKFTVDPGNQPDFVLNDSKQDIGDWEVRNELGMELDNSLEDLNVAQEYVNALSDDDYQTWRKLRDEGYSVNATKTLMDNQDLLWDINNPGVKKYLSNKPTLLGELTEMAQAYNLGYEQVLHPWTESIQSYLDKGNLRLEENLGKENMMNRWIEKQNPYGKMSPNLAEGTINNYETFVNMAQIPKVLGQMILSIGSSGVNTLDEYFNRMGIHSANLMNLLNQKAETGKGVNVNYGEDRSNLIGSYLQTVADVLDIHLTTAYPIVTYIFGLLGANQTDRDSIGEVIDRGPEAIADYLLGLDVVETFMDNNLNEEDQLAAKQAIKYGIYEAIARLLKWGGKKINSSEAVQNFKMVSEKVDNYGKRNAALETKKYYEMREAAGKEPVGTEILEGERPIAKSTEKGGEFTSEGALDTLVAGVKGYVKGVKEYLSSYFRNRNRQLLPRDPNAPVGELPEIGGKPVQSEVVKPTEEITPKEEVKIEDLKETPKPNLKKAAPKVETSKGTMGEGISSFVKRVTNSLAGTEGGLNQEMITKLQNSPQLQNEYVNTIDPYLRSNGAENPAGVIKDQLADFVQTAKDQLETRRENNMEFRKGQMKYQVEIPESEKLKWKLDDLELKNLIKMLSKSQDNPEQFLKYLLNLPKEQIQSFEKYIPDFTQNLGIIQDTLELTKAITKPDIVDKFLSYKSSWGSRRKGFVRKMIYEYLKNKYKEMGVQYNMKEVERILNNMSEEELVQLESEVNKGDIRPYMSDAEFTDLLDKGYTPGTWVPANQNINEIMDSKRPGTNKTTREYLKEKGVQLSLTNERGLQKIGGNIQAAYSAKLDRILMKSENNPYKGIIYHEFGHRVLAQLGTTQIMDIITHIAERDGITQDAAFERRAEYFRNYLQYNNVDGKKYLIKNLGKDIASKINATMEKTKEEIWDLFDLDEGDKNINQILSDVKHDTPKGKDITSRRPEPIVNDMVPQSSPVRYEYLRTIDPNIDSVEVYPYFDKPIQIKFKDGSTQRWTEYRKTLTPEQLKEVDTYETDIIREFVDEQIGRNKGFKGEGNFNYDTLENEKNLTDILMDQSLKSFQQTKETLGLDAFETAGYLKSLKNIDPDIIGLVEKDGKLCVQVLFESMRERWELPDRPGMVEMKTIPIDEFFVLPEDIKQLPEDLQKLIKKDAD